MTQTKTSDVGPAFPQGHTDGPTVDPTSMTLRDYLAAQALCGYLAGRNTHSRDTRADIVAESCYAYADALLEERGGK